MNVPFIDLRIQHRILQPKLNEAVQRVMERADFALGEDVTQFEEEFAAFCGVAHAVGVASGISALELILRAYEIGPGDEVIVPAHTFIATAAAVTFCGAQPVLVDVDPVTYDIDVTQIEAAITPHTRAIIPVHLYGLPADMEAITALAARHDLVVVEDACQAHGAYYKNRRTGSLGHAAAFSFYPTKNLGGCGDGGMVVTSATEVADRVRAMRNCGQRVKNCHELSPFNSRLDTIQAALLRVKLDRLDRWNHMRQQAAILYDKLLADSDVALPQCKPDATHVFHLYVIRTVHRDKLQSYLKAQGIGTAIHYPVPVHRQPFYVHNGVRHRGLPQTEQLCDEVLSLPMYPEITADQVHYVATQILEFSKVLAV